MGRYSQRIVCIIIVALCYAGCLTVFTATCFWLQIQLTFNMNSTSCNCRTILPSSHSNFKLVLNNESWRARESLGWPVTVAKYEVKWPLVIVINDVLATSMTLYIVVAVLFINELRTIANVKSPLVWLNRHTEHIFETNFTLNKIKAVT